MLPSEGAKIAYVRKEQNSWILGHLLQQALQAKLYLDTFDSNYSDSCDTPWDYAYLLCEQREKEFLLYFLMYPNTDLKMWLGQILFSGFSVANGRLFLPT